MKVSFFLAYIMTNRFFYTFYKQKKDATTSFVVAPFNGPNAQLSIRKTEFPSSELFDESFPNRHPSFSVNPTRHHVYCFTKNTSTY